MVTATAVVAVVVVVAVIVVLAVIENISPNTLYPKTTRLVIAVSIHASPSNRKYRIQNPRVNAPKFGFSLSTKTRGTPNSNSADKTFCVLPHLHTFQGISADSVSILVSASAHLTIYLSVVAFAYAVSLSLRVLFYLALFYLVVCLSSSVTAWFFLVGIW